MNVNIEKIRIDSMKRIKKNIGTFLDTYKEDMYFSEENLLKLNKILIDIILDASIIQNTKIELVSSAGTKLTIM